MQRYVAGIMNSQGNTQGPPGLVAPPQMVDPNQQQGGQQHMGYPNSPQPPSSYPNGPSPQNGPPPQQQGKYTICLVTVSCHAADNIYVL